MGMETSSLDAKLKLLIDRRNVVANDAQRIAGRLAAARQSLAEAETECRQRGIEPEHIDVRLAELVSRYETLIGQLEAEVVAAETAIAPLKKEI